MGTKILHSWWIGLLIVCSQGSDVMGNASQWSDRHITSCLFGCYMPQINWQALVEKARRDMPFTLLRNIICQKVVQSPFILYKQLLCVCLFIHKGTLLGKWRISEVCYTHSLYWVIWIKNTSYVLCHKIMTPGEHKPCDGPCVLKSFIYVSNVPTCYSLYMDPF